MRASDLLIYTFPSETFQGGLPPPQALSQAPPEVRDAPSVTALPNFFSLSTVISKPEDQGQRGTCATFAVSAVAELAVNQELSEQHIYLQAWNSYYAGNPGSLEEGTSLEAVGGILATQGACAEEVWAYNRERNQANPSQGTPPARVGGAKKFRIGSFNVASPQAPAHAAICTQIYRDRKPLILSVPVLADAGWDSGFIVDVPKGGEHLEGWHAIVAVGFNLGAKLLIIQNSWGPYWAVCGYAAITFDYIDRYTRTIASIA
jgi:hypothetical protein